MAKYYLSKIRLNNGGYDSRGQYWGIDWPLFKYEYDSDSNTYVNHVRASNREHAKTLIGLEDKQATFYR